MHGVPRNGSAWGTRLGTSRLIQTFLPVTATYTVYQKCLGCRRWCGISGRSFHASQSGLMGACSEPYLILHREGSSMVPCLPVKPLAMMKVFCFHQYMLMKKTWFVLIVDVHVYVLLWGTDVVIVCWACCSEHGAVGGCVVSRSYEV